MSVKNYHFLKNYNLNPVIPSSNFATNQSKPKEIIPQKSAQTNQANLMLQKLNLNTNIVNKQNSNYKNNGFNKVNDLYTVINSNFKTINKNTGNEYLENILRNQDKVKDKNENSFKKTLRNEPRKLSPDRTASLNKNASQNNLNSNKLDNLLQSYSNSQLINQNKGNYLNQVMESQSQSKYPKVFSEENNTQENYNESNGKNEKYFYLNTTTSVKDYCYYEDQNSKYRQYMEDFTKIIDKFSGDKSKGLFNMFDGHGGTEISKYCKDRYSELFQSFYELHPTNIEKAISLTFLKLDEEIKLMDSDNKGSTACCLFITNELNNFRKRSLYSSNIGDTRCLLISNNSFKRLSEDHRCSEMKEVLRVKGAGGRVFDGRVYGQLMITRAFGDHSLKSCGVSAVPYINKHIINEDNDKYVVIASDGVWDVVEDEHVYSLSQNARNTEELCKMIINTAVKNGTKDNISCIVIKL